MGGVNEDYGQSGDNGQASDPMGSMQAKRQSSASQEPMFGKMNAWNVQGDGSEKIAAGFAEGFQNGVSLGMAKKAKDKQEQAGDGKVYQGKKVEGGQMLDDSQLVDEYGYPYSLGANGQPTYN